mmetsp:Transcript_52263/g.154265  ORF Transcript_52263/g.154265 Transcript_52263/m.154265 type:complete len:252 (-) Transcript_52263:3388-4143(-)
MASAVCKTRPSASVVSACSAMKAIGAWSSTLDVPRRNFFLPPVSWLTRPRPSPSLTSDFRIEMLLDFRIEMLLTFLSMLALRSFSTSSLHLSLRPVSPAITSIRSFNDAMTSSSPAFGFQNNFLGLLSNASRVLRRAVLTSLMSFVPISFSSTGMPPGLSISIWLSKSIANLRISSMTNPRPWTFKRTSGVFLRWAWTISSKHQGRVRTPLVPRSTMTSESFTPSRISRRKSARDELSRNTGQRSIFRKTS